jgi:hypothetical protein
MVKLKLAIKLLLVLVNIILILLVEGLGENIILVSRFMLLALFLAHLIHTTLAQEALLVTEI